MPNLQDVQSKIAALLVKAAGTDNEHEAQIYEAKAMDLMAKYGVEEAAARAEAERRHEPVADRAATSYVVRNYTGKYHDAQQMLLVHIAAALHCETVGFIGQANHTLMVYGVPQQIERFKVLRGLLVPQMLQGAAKARPLAYHTPGQMRIFRRSWMRGFAIQIHHRIAGTEKRMLQSAPGAALVLASDHDKAKALAKLEHPKLKYTTSRARGSREGFEQGKEAGRRAQLTQHKQLA